MVKMGKIFIPQKGKQSFLATYNLIHILHKFGTRHAFKVAIPENLKYIFAHQIKLLRKVLSVLLGVNFERKNQRYWFQSISMSDLWPRKLSSQTTFGSAHYGMTILMAEDGHIICNLHARYPGYKDIANHLDMLHEQF